MAGIPAPTGGVHRFAPAVFEALSWRPRGWRRPAVVRLAGAGG